MSAQYSHVSLLEHTPSFVFTTCTFHLFHLPPSLPAYLPVSLIVSDMLVPAETRLCISESAAPVPYLQCVLIDWIAPARPSACIWPEHHFSSAKQQMPI